MTAWYNEIDPYAAEWLRNLIAEGLIAPGDVDERDIRDVRPSDLTGYTQCHFFAGIGVWSHSLRRAGWPDDRPVWTGSCPCQPFSAAGGRAGFADERHLWPAFHHLIRQCRPPVVLGEQVASKDGLQWFDLVSADLEGAGYAVGAADMCAAGVGAPHIRQRLWFVGVADADRGQRNWLAGGEGGQPDGAAAGRIEGDSGAGRGGADGGLDDAAGARQFPERCGPESEARDEARLRLPGEGCDESGRPGPVNGLWRAADWLFCRDGKWRPVEARPQPLVDGSAPSLGRVRPEIVAQIAEEVDAAAMETEGDSASAMRALWRDLAAQAQRGWEAGRLPGLHAPAFLLAFVRQLAAQGWAVAQGVALPCEETAALGLRVLREREAAPSASCQRGLDGQQPGQSPDLVHLLSSLLARHASAAWADAYSAYSEIGFPLGRDAPARVGRLRAYGNAIVAPVAEAFVESVMEAL